ncbi:DASH complex subunit DAM1 [Teratosphaeria destructans]|uniref:DASH complex subunit DAM1 n=1 Tax=Teratosphaeria destructans TaxID=418781 RepID=A0A9W7T0U3_9PEZI|nr:DASH complex subunit DAM1 [Teratosphaeria destructans]
MATTATPATHIRRRDSSHSRTRIPSRPTTPLRPPSRTSLRASQSTPSGNASTTSSDFALASLEPAFAELSDSMADLEANMMHLQLLNESLGRFNENFGAFLYGMNMSAFCVDFPEAPIPQSFARKDTSGPSQMADSPFRTQVAPPDTDATFLTSDTSFVNDPPMSVKANKYSAPPSAAGSRQSTIPPRGLGTRGGTTRGRAGAAAARGTRGGIGNGRAGSGVARGSGRGRGGVR